MKILFKDIPPLMRCTIRGHKAVRAGGNLARANLFGTKLPEHKWEEIYVRPDEVCEITDILADMNNLGRFGIPPRPDTMNPFLPLKGGPQGYLDNRNKRRALTPRPDDRDTSAKDNEEQGED